MRNRTVGKLLEMGNNNSAWEDVFCKPYSNIAREVLFWYLSIGKHSQKSIGPNTQVTLASGTSSHVKLTLTFKRPSIF